MPPVYALIPDAQVAAYRPVTASLIRRLRNNVEASRRWDHRNVYGSIGGATTSSTFVNVGTPFYYLVPDCFIGVSGVTMAWILDLITLGAASEAEARVRATWNAGADSIESDVLAIAVGENPVKSGQVQFTIDTLAPDTVLECHVQARSVGGVVSWIASWFEDLGRSPAQSAQAYLQLER